MDFISTDISYGTVQEVPDKLGRCRIKLLYEADIEDGSDAQYPLYTWLSSPACGSFSALNVGDTVLCFVDKKNTELRWYTRHMVIKDGSSLSHLLEGDLTDIDVLVCRDGKNTTFQLYASDGTGWILSTGGTVLNINTDGSVSLSTQWSHRGVSVSDSSISLGPASGDAAEPAVLGDKMTDYVDKIDTLLEDIQKAASASPYTKQIETTIQAEIGDIKDAAARICSDNVRID